MMSDVSTSYEYLHYAYQQTIKKVKRLKKKIKKLKRKIKKCHT